MKHIFAFAIAVMFIVAGCTVEKPKELKSYILSEKEVSCIEGISVMESFPPQVGQVIYPKDLKIKDTPECEGLFKDYQNKVIIGKTLQLGGCLSFDDKIEITKDDMAKKVQVTFVISSAPPDTVCTKEIKFEDAWVAVDYLSGYVYTFGTKQVVRDNQTNDIPKSVLDKYEELRQASTNELPERLAVCTKGSETRYTVSSDIEVDGPIYVYDRNGTLLGFSGFEADPVDFTGYNCTEIKISSGVEPSGHVPFVELTEDIESCLVVKNTTGEPVDGRIYYPGSYDLRDTPACQGFKQYEDKAIVGKIIPLRNGCERFGGTEIERDDQGKKVIVNFIRSTAPEDVICTMVYSEFTKWVAVDYLEGYDYEAKIKDVVREGGTPGQIKSVYTPTELKNSYADLVGKTVNVSGTVKAKYVVPPCPVGELCNPPAANPYLNLTDGTSDIIVNFLSANGSYVQSISINELVTFEVSVLSESEGGFFVKNENGVYLFIGAVSQAPSADAYGRFLDAGCIPDPADDSEGLNCENTSFVRQFGCMEPQFMRLRVEGFELNPERSLLECRIEGDRMNAGQENETFGCDGGFLYRCTTYVTPGVNEFININNPFDLARLTAPIETEDEARAFALLSAIRSHWVVEGNLSLKGSVEKRGEGFIVKLYQSSSPFGCIDGIDYDEVRYEVARNGSIKEVDRKVHVYRDRFEFPLCID